MLIRRIARPLLGSFFITAGSDALRHPAPAPAAGPLVDKALAALPEQVAQRLPRDPEVYARVNGAVQLVAGLALASGKLPRVSSLVLASTVVPATLASHAFWQEQDPELKARQKAHFWKNASILGGLIIAGVDTEGRPGLSWRARRAAKDAAAAVVSAIPGGSQPSSLLADRAHGLADNAAERWAEATAVLDEKSSEWGKKAEKAQKKLQKKAEKLREQAEKKAPVIVEGVSERIGETAEVLENVAAQWGGKAEKAQKKLQKKAVSLREQAEKKLPLIVEDARQRGAELGEITSRRAEDLAESASKQAVEFAKAAAKSREQLETLVVDQKPKLRKLFRVAAG